jgi:glycosyltransferase involved in cell wall biosynthesis
VARSDARTGGHSVVFVGSSLPRQCGIATFTASLLASLSDVWPEGSVSHIAVTDTDSGYDYPPTVRFEIREKDISFYRRAADFLNVNNFGVVCLQHEYGLFGGPAGSHILALIRELRMPVVTTLHTILRNPDPQVRQVTEELLRRSDRLVTMSHRGRQMLRELYAVPEDKIEVIPHGVPDLPFIDPSFYKDQFGVEGKLVIMTFGLLSPNKGIEYVIDALPQILERHPNVVYMLVGATHPVLKRREGEAYRLALERLAQERGVEGQVIFHDRFVSDQELAEFLCAADIYITPYLNEEQITSGTLSYAVGAGKAIVSTPYWHAQELLADGRGVLVPFRDANAIAREVIRLLDDVPQRDAMRKAAYLLGREMTWRRVAERYVQCFERARTRRAGGAFRLFEAKTLGKRPRDLPPVNLNHLRRLTDDTGILQHCVFAIPDYLHGYTTDDNARALVLSLLLEQAGEPTGPFLGLLQARYLAFLWSAFDPDTQRFRNFMSYDRRWVEDRLSEDAHGRAIWALGTAVSRCQEESFYGPASRLFEPAVAQALNLRSPRAWAFSLLGIHEYLRRFCGARDVIRARELLAERLLELFRQHSSSDWVWFENCLAYDNATLPHALLHCGQDMNRSDMLEAALRSLEWLCAVQRPEGRHFVPIGTEGWYHRGRSRARFDQQPIEAYATVSACLEAHRMTGDTRWLREAQIAFDWFMGRNDLHQSLYDPATGGCRDGLHCDRANQNQGAESTLAFLLALTEMRLSEYVIRE